MVVLSVIGTHVEQARAEPTSSLAEACAAAIRTIEWRWVKPLLLFTFIFHVAVATILLGSGLPVGYFPMGQGYVLIMFMLGCIVSSWYIFGPQVAVDMVRQVRGLQVTPFNERIAHMVKLIAAGWVLVLIFGVVMMTNANLKPAIFALNPVNYDSQLEAVERALFGGVLPTEWFLTHSSTPALHAWDFVYRLFCVFLFASMMIALHLEGMRGGARFILALSAALFITQIASVMYPTWGPIYEHPNWFHVLWDTRTHERAHNLALSVQQYLAEPKVRYAVAGISAMPSYHVAAWSCGLMCWLRLPRLLLAFGCVLVVLNWISTVVLGWHYALDGAAGIVVAVVATALAVWVIPKASQTSNDPPAADRTI
ncbi:MAG: phosphatase PAP2 family protein [Planctomycetes bacterium]|nr:phosphatase PAP2 family protein [Planctomycetota bacterium]